MVRDGGVEAVQPAITREVVPLSGGALVEGVCGEVVAHQLVGQVGVVFVVVLKM